MLKISIVYIYADIFFIGLIPLATFGNQSDQIGRFCKVLGNKFYNKSSQNIKYFGYFLTERYCYK